MRLNECVLAAVCSSFALLSEGSPAVGFNVVRSLRELALLSWGWRIILCLVRTNVNFQHSRWRVPGFENFGSMR